MLCNCFQTGVWGEFRTLLAEILNEPELRVWKVQVDDVIMHPNYTYNSTARDALC